MTWLLTLLCLLRVGLTFAAPGPSIEVSVSKDVLLTVLLELGFADLYQVSCASKGLCSLANQAIRALYGIQVGGRACLNYTSLLDEFDRLARDGWDDKSAAEADRIAEVSAHCMCIQTILEAQFGCCIKYAKDRLPEFYLCEGSLDILNYQQRLSVLPYVIDQMASGQRWAHYIRGLVELGHFSLLDQVTFSKLDARYFVWLMSVPLPEPVVVAAAKSLCKNEPSSKLSGLAAWAVLGDQTAPLPESCQVPLYLLRYLHGDGPQIPPSAVLVDGLDESSIPFWIYVTTKEVNGARELLELILRHGDTGTKRLAGAFHEQILSSDLEGPQKDVYQAVLTRFRFSAICNEQVVQNYSDMTGRLASVGYHAACAFIDCGQYSLLDLSRLDVPAKIDIDALVDKMHRLHDDRLDLLIREGIRRLDDAAGLLKHLIKRKADDAYVQLVWDSIQSAHQFRSLGYYCCFVPVAVLRGLACDPGFSVEHACQVLGMLTGFRHRVMQVSKEAHIFYTALFWEAPEEVISQLFDQLPDACELNRRFVWKLLQVPKYSGALCTKLIRHFGPVNMCMYQRLKAFRPDLIGGVDLQDESL